MKRILLAVDGGAPSWEAARLTAHLAPKLKALVTVLTVFVPGPLVDEATSQRTRDYKAAQQLVEHIVRELRGEGARGHGEVVGADAGDVHTEIVASARRHSADLVVVGSRARGELTGLLLGSVSQKVAAASDCPVLVVPAGTMTTVVPRRMVLVIDATAATEVPIRGGCGAGSGAEAVG